MNFRSVAATLLISVGTCSFALGDDARDAPPNGLLFPKSVERTMMGEPIKMRQKYALDMIEGPTTSEFIFEGPTSLDFGAISIDNDNAGSVHVIESPPCGPKCVPPPNRHGPAPCNARWLPPRRRFRVGRCPLLRSVQ